MQQKIKTIGINKSFNRANGCNNSKHLHDLQQTIKMHEAKMDKTEGRNRYFYNNSWKQQYPTHNTEENGGLNIINQLELTCTQHPTQQQQHTRPCQVHVGHFPGQTIYQATNYSKYF